MLTAAVLGGMTNLFADCLTSDALRLDFAPAEQGFGVGVACPHADSFWTLRFRAGAANADSEIVLNNRSSCRVRRMERTPDGGAVFIWKGLDLGDEKSAVNVRARITFPTLGESAWTLEVQNTSTRYGLFETSYPEIASAIPEGCDLLLPRKDLGARFIRNAKLDKDHVFGCMGYSPMMMAAFRGASGLYFAAHDSQARIKHMKLGKDRSFAFVTPIENGGLPGRAAEGPRYAVTIAALEGDWWAAAKRYRAWALTAPWTAKGPIATRADYPRRLAEIPLWINTHTLPAAASNTLARAAEIFPGVPVGLHWHLWQHSGHDVNYPEYFPEQPGTREVLAACRAFGAEPMPYTNGRLWSTNLVGYALARPFAIRKADGEPIVERYGTLTPPMSPICPATAMWDGILNGFAARILDLGAGSIFLDQIGACPGIPCYCADHGHPLGGGTWYYDGYQTLLAKTHAAYAAKGAFITTEGSGEQWMNVIDGYLNVTQRGTDDVPFFHAVYSGYTTYFCSPENDRDDPDSFWAAQAREVVWGQSLGWYHPAILDDAEKCAFIRRLVDFRQRNLDYLAYGTMEDGIRFLDAVPEQKVEWLGRKAFYLWTVKDAPLSPTIRGTLPAVVGIVWKSAKGNLAAFLANLSNREQTVRFAFAGSEQRRTLAPRELSVVQSPTSHLHLPPSPSTSILWPSPDAKVKSQSSSQVTVTNGLAIVETGEGFDYPGLRLDFDRDGVDWSKYGALSVTVTNMNPTRLTLVQMSVKSKTYQGQSPSGYIKINPFKSGTMTISLRSMPWVLDRPLKLEGMRGSPKPAQTSMFDLRKVVSLHLFTHKPSGPEKFALVRAELLEAPVSSPVKTLKAETFKPFVDVYGQFAHDDWPGKIHGDDELRASAREEAAWLGAHAESPIAGRDEFGGWAAGPQLKTTGYFRTEKVNGKWWLVDPAGHLFFSHGICCVNLSDGKTGVQYRDDYFADLPAKDDPVFGRFWDVCKTKAARGFYADTNHYPYATYNHGQANLLRRYGDDWQNISRDLAHRRMKAWGINTIANWSDEEICRMDRTPYTLCLGTSGTPRLDWATGWWGKLPDPFHPLFEKRFRERCRKAAKWMKTDKWCLGVFVDNEMSWSDDPRMADVAERYFSVVSRVLREELPNHLYLGCRIASGTDVIYRAAAKYCDVVSVNIYARLPQRDLPADAVDKPMINGEFHFGALDRGLFHTGLVATLSQQERAECYETFVNACLDHPRMVGTHWFQWRDMALTGRSDGECYQVGFVTITDTPYPEIIEASRRVAAGMYERRVKR